MLVLKCMKCGNVSAFDTRVTGPQLQALKCPFCGHEDYLAAWLGKSQDAKASVAGEVVKEIRLLINDSARRLDLNGQFDALSRKYNLSTLTLLRLVNILAASVNDDKVSTARLNVHRYSKIEEKSVSGKALLEIVMNQLAIKGNAADENSSRSGDHESVEALQANYADLERKHIQLKKDFETLRMENERLKKEIKKYKDFWD